MRGENFIYFSTVSGFFIGLIYSIFAELDVFYFIFAVIVITAIFYIISLSSVAFFIKFLNIKNSIFFDKEYIDNVLNLQIEELEKTEDFIYENYEFLKELEKSEIDILRKRKNV